MEEVRMTIVCRFHNCINMLRNYMYLNPGSFYFFNLMKSLLLYQLSGDLTKEAASLQSLIFISMYFLKVRSVLSGLKVLSGQLFWILGAHIQKQHFTSNAVMSMIMFLDPEILAVQGGLLATHIFLLMFRNLPVERGTVCLVVSAAFAVVWYTIWCKKYIIDAGFIVNLYFAFQFWLPKLTKTPVTVILAIWILLVFAGVRF